jgi:hypothetical protein
MFSDNIVERHQSLADLASLNPSSYYFIGVVVLAVLSFWLKDLF